MHRASLCALLIMVATASLISCGAKPESGGEQTAAAASPAASAASAVTLRADLDQGPRAGESPYDEAKAKVGEGLFQTKGCSACHAFGRRVTGPDLAGVTTRRTTRWMENQILHPDLMVKQNPISRQLFAQFALQMPNQGLTPEEASAVIEFLKHKDHGAGEGREAGKEKH